MLIRTLKKYQPINLIIFLAISILAWLHPLIDANLPGLQIVPDPMPLYGIIVKALGAPNYSFLCKLIAFIFVVLQAFIINGILNQYNLLGFRSYLPGIIFIILSSTFIEYQVLQPIMFSNFFLLFAWNRVIGIHEKENTFEAYFNASFLIGLASLFYPNSIYFLIVLFLSIGLNRVGNSREFAMIFAGFIAVWYFYLSLYFIVTSSISFPGFDFNFGFLFPKFPFILLTQLVIITLVVIFLLAGSLQLISYMSNMKIPMRRNLKFLFIWFWIGIFALVLTHSSIEIIYVISLPVAVLFTLFFINFKKGLLREIIWAFFILCIILNKAFPNLIKF